LKLNNLTTKYGIKSIEIEKGIIKHISDTPFNNGIDCQNLIAIPGLIDVHTHGIMGCDTMDGDVKTLSEHYARVGTTTVYPTTMTMGFDELTRVVNQDLSNTLANVPGFHLEGPYISKNKKGAQDEKHIRIPDAEEFLNLPNVKMVTMAPEAENGLDFIEKVKDKAVVSIGHTDCDYDTALKAIDKGANCLTHTFNAMPSILHRAPGPISAAMDREIYAQIICDGVHIHPAVIRMAYKIFGKDRLVLISDSLNPTGLTDGEYLSGGLNVTLKNGVAKLKDGTIAGSTSTLLDCVLCANKFGIPFFDAVDMASLTPAKMMKLNKGELKEGKDADILLLDKNYSLNKVIINGEFIKNC